MKSRKIERDVPFSFPFLMNFSRNPIQQFLLTSLARYILIAIPSYRKIGESVFELQHFFSNSFRIFLHEKKVRMGIELAKLNDDSKLQTSSFLAQ